MNDEMELLPAIEPLSGLDRWREESLLLDFVSGDPLDERLTTVRASEASYFDADGVLQFANPNTPRIDYDPITRACRGLLVEEARTNLCAYSEDFSTWAGPGVSSLGKAINAAIAPNGLLSATRVSKPAAPFQYAVQSFSAVAGQVYTGSIFAKAGSLSKVSLLITGDSAVTLNGRVKFDLSAGTWVNSGSTNFVAVDMKPLADGWWRISLTATLTTNTSPRFYFYPGGHDESASGDTLLWGAQVEQGAFPASYVRTLPQFQSRASTATYFDAQGVMQTAAANEPRHSHGYVDGRWVSTGLLVEGQATNLARYSEDWLASGGWRVGAAYFRRSVAANHPNRPGLDVCEYGPVAGQQAWTNDVVNTEVTLSAGVYTYTADFKPVGATTMVRLSPVHIASTNFLSCMVSLIDGSVTGKYGDYGTTFSPDFSASGAPIGNGWWRVTMTFTVLASFVIRLRAVPYLSGGAVMTGDGTSGLQGTMLSFTAGNTSTSYIRTTNEAVTRAADVAPSAAVTRGADTVYVPTASFHVPGAWTLIAEATQSPTTQYWSGIAAFTSPGSPGNNFMGIAQPAGGSYAGKGIRVQGEINGTQQFGINVGTAEPEAIFKVAMTRQASGVAVSLNGNAVLTGVAGTEPVVTQLAIGGFIVGTTVGRRHMRRVAVVPRALDNGTIKRLSTR